MKEGFKTWASCVGSFGNIVVYQFVSGTILSLLLMLLTKLAMMVLASTGRVAVTTGDFLFLFTTWQGILLLLFGLISLYFYVVIDINTKIVFANKLLKNENYTLLSLLKESLMTLPRFFNAGGTLIILFVSLLAPLTGIGVYISLTRNFKIPSFISSVIESNALYRVIYCVVILALIAVAVLHVFSIFAIVIDNVKPKEAFVLSRRLIIKNWKSYLKQSVAFFFSTFFSGAFAILIAVVLLLAAYFFMANLIVAHERMAFVFVVLLIVAGVLIFNFIGSFCYIVRISQMYYTYQEREEEIPFEQKKKHGIFFALSGVFVVALLLLGSRVIDANFDQLFTGEVSVSVIAHRGGGTEAPENTVEGVRKASSLGVYGSEIDIQRTSDGYYVVNHDGTFERLCNVGKKPEEMTLAEVKELLISDPLFPDQQQPVATFEEMLEAAKGNVVLFTELKGNTADRQMVDDAVTLIRRYGMEDGCVLISLQYDVIDYAETTYPEIQTAYLMFASFGDVASLNCDYLGLEEEIATPVAVQAAHDQNKKVLVWTPNTEKSQHYFLMSSVDAIITDNISQANGIIRDLEARSDIEIFLDYIINLIF